MTDANVVLGHLPADLIGGEMSLDVEAARTAVQKVADAMGLSLEEAADGILRIVNENMAGALRVISVQRGHDPREFALVAFGGAGPLHANAVAELMGSFPVIVPPVARAAVRARRPRRRLPQRVRADADPADRRGVRRRAARDPRRARRRARASGWTRRASRRPTSTSSSSPTCATAARATRSRCRGSEDLEERFNALHEQLYGFRMPNTASEIVNLRAVGTGDRPEPELPEEEPRRGALAAGHLRARRPASRARRIAGPSIVTEFDSTTVVLDGYTAEIDRYFNLLIRPEAS